MIWVAAAFLSGSIPFSYIIARWFLKQDIRTVGDRNPGATNVLRASGSKSWFILAFLLDTFKGTLPVGLAYWIAGIKGAEIALIATAAVAGHAFSPWLGWRGGKAVATTFGVWMGLTIWELPTMLGILLLYWFRSVKESDWAVVLTWISILPYLILTGREPELLVLWVCNGVILLWKHRSSLGHWPTIRRWLPVLPKTQSNGAA